MRKTISQVSLPLFLATVLFSPGLAAQIEPAAEAYAKGQAHLALRTSEGVAEARAQFERAIKADPTFAPAFAGLAEIHALLYDYPEAKEAALRALALDERLAAAHAVLGFARMHGDRDWAGAEAELRRALELDPQRSGSHVWYAILLEVTGRSPEAVTAARRAVELAPDQASVRAGLGYRLFWARRYDKAVTELKAALELDPSLATAHYFIGRARVQQRRFEEARAAFTRAREISPEDGNLVSAMGFLAARAGRPEEARRVLSKLERLAADGLPFASQIAGVYAALGEKETALDWLTRASLKRESALLWLAIDPRFDSLRGEPRFQELLKRMGLGEERRGATSATD